MGISRLVSSDIKFAWRICVCSPVKSQSVKGWGAKLFPENIMWLTDLAPNLLTSSSALVKWWNSISRKANIVAAAHTDTAGDLYSKGQFTLCGGSTPALNSYPDISSLIYHTVALNMEQFWCSVRHWTVLACPVLQLLGFIGSWHLDSSLCHWSYNKYTI